MRLPGMHQGATAGRAVRKQSSCPWCPHLLSERPLLSVPGFDLGQGSSLQPRKALKSVPGASLHPDQPEVGEHLQT